MIKRTLIILGIGLFLASCQATDACRESIDVLQVDGSYQWRCVEYHVQ